MRKPVFICLPYHNHEATMVYAGTQRPQTDGDVIKICFNDDDEPYKMVPVQLDGKQVA